MLFNFPQFINWIEVAEPGKSKPRKVPFDGSLPPKDQYINPHDPRHWRTYEQAAATGKVGFVFTPFDPFFFFDLDDCHTQAGGWSPEATAIYQQFPGAAAEVSISGTGLHIVGVCDQARLADRRNKWGTGGKNWLEFYTRDRFMALGHGFHGNFAVDWTETLLRIVPRRDPVEQGVLTAGAAPGYTGPTDDGELIQRMLNSRGSIGSQFGQKASTQALWTGDAAILCQAFPSVNGDVYDRSSADMALMMHLAFWTGRDAARMDRIFRQSALFRPKYRDREDYRAGTIGEAIGKCKKIYDVPRDTKAPPEPEASPGGTAGEFLTIGEQIDHFAGCVYVRDAHRIMIPGGTMLKSEQFNVTYGGKVFQMTAANDGTTKKAFEAFTENRGYQFPKADSTCFRPMATPGVIIDGKVNVYFPQPVRALPGDATRFLDLVAKLYPDPHDRMILLSYMAAVVQQPGRKFQWAPVLQGAQGNGKTVVAKCLEYAVGPRYTHCPGAEDLGNPFNSYIENKLLISVEEVHLQGKRELLDTLKPLITNDRIEVQPKGIDKRMVDNVANWFFCTNHRDAIVKTKNDRRYAMLFSAQQSYEDILRDGMGGEYFPAFWDWLRSDGFSIVAHFLQTFAIPAALNPGGACHRAPETTSTNAAIMASMGRAEQEVVEAVEAGDAGFRRGWISVYRLDELLKEKHIRISRMKMAEMLEEMGYRNVGRAGKIIMSEDGKRPMLYVHRSLYHGGLSVDDYCLAQGYPAALGPTVVTIPGQRVA
jgi:primase-polymerase (primpol)-like protein